MVCHGFGHGISHGNPHEESQLDVKRSGLLRNPSAWLGSLGALATLPLGIPHGGFPIGDYPMGESPMGEGLEGQKDQMYSLLACS